MKRKPISFMMFLVALILTSCSSRENDGIIREEGNHTYDDYPVVYVTPDVSAKGLVSAYELLEIPDCENVAINLPATEADTSFVWDDLLGELRKTLGNAVIIENVPEADFSDYDCTVVLSHFCSHDTIGFNGAVKQTASLSDLTNETDKGQDEMERLAKSAKQAIDKLNGKIVYICVMNRLSIESVGITLPESNTYDIGILSSYDPVALDQACIDLIYMLKEGTPLTKHIESCNGIYTLAHAESLGVGSRTYALTISDSSRIS